MRLEEKRKNRLAVSMVFVIFNTNPPRQTSLYQKPPIPMIVGPYKIWCILYPIAFSSTPKFNFLSFVFPGFGFSNNNNKKITTK